jgi:amino-acid N-acetyltransferase
MSTKTGHLEWFRTASPYIYAHRQKTFVIMLDQAALCREAMIGICGDLTLLHALGVRLILVHGNPGDVQVDTAANVQPLPLTTARFAQYLQETSTATQNLMAQLSSGSTQAITRPSDLVALSGNFIRARPLGVIDGIDQQQAGTVRSVNATAINQALDNQALVIIPPVGYSLSGESFGLDATILAQAVASSIEADKLIYFIDAKGLEDETGQVLSEITSGELSPSDWPLLASTLMAAKQAIDDGTKRCHLVSYQHDGALLEELFTREGCGTQIVSQKSSSLRPAMPNDISGILRLVEPLEATGALVKRSRELIESELDNFWVVEHEHTIIACAALYAFGTSGEVACMATDPTYRDENHGEALLNALIRSAKQQHLSEVFVLTTQAAHWFLERGFISAPVTSLPKTKQKLYNWQRNAKVYTRAVV